jgi:hypothetical protein
MRCVVEWNGRDVPAALRDLPPGRYLLEEEPDPAGLEGLRGLASREACIPPRGRASEQSEQVQPEERTCWP